MGDIVELNRKHADLTVDEVFALAQREEFDEVMIVGLHKDERGFSVWVSEMPNERAHWFASKAEAAILRCS